MDDKALRTIVMKSILDLETHEIDMFLDAATVLYQRNEKQALQAWATLYPDWSSPEEALKNLKLRSLVKTTGGGNLWVHDVIKGHAGAIAQERKESEGHRVWRPTQVGWQLYIFFVCPVYHVKAASLGKQLATLWHTLIA